MVDQVAAYVRTHPGIVTAETCDYLARRYDPKYLEYLEPWEREERLRELGRKLGVAVPRRISYRRPEALQFLSRLPTIIRRAWLIEHLKLFPGVRVLLKVGAADSGPREASIARINESFALVVEGHKLPWSPVMVEERLH